MKSFFVIAFDLYLIPVVCVNVDTHHKISDKSQVQLSHTDTEHQAIETPIEAVSRHLDRETVAQTANVEFNQLNESSRSPRVSSSPNLKE